MSFKVLGHYGVFQHFTVSPEVMVPTNVLQILLAFLGSQTFTSVFSRHQISFGAPWCILVSASVSCCPLEVPVV